MDSYAYLFENDNIEELVLLKGISHLYKLSKKNKKRGGSAFGRRVISRDHDFGHERLYHDYFSENPVYSDELFRRRFRMNRDLFLRLVDAVKIKDDFFIQKKDATGRLQLSSLQKVTAAIRQLAYGISSDAVDEYIRIADSTAMVCLKRFCYAVVALFKEEYLRTPNSEDVKNLLSINKARGFPGMLGSIDCMHWTWKNCPTAWQGMYTGKDKVPTLILEAVASQDLWIWHSFFGLPGSLNDINVLNRSHVFDALENGSAPEVEYVINGHTYNKGYFLADGIYPSLATIVKTIPAPLSQKEKVY